MALIILVALAYWPATQGTFIWDDDYYVSNNPTLRTTRGLKDIWVDPKATPQYYPMVFTSFWLEYRLWELNPEGYHWTNILLHGINSGLFYLVLRRLEVPLPWLAAAIFALHPVQVESVAWITERKNVLSGFFYLAAFLLFFRFAMQGPGTRSQESGAGNQEARERNQEPGNRSLQSQGSGPETGGRISKANSLAPGSRLLTPASCLLPPGSWLLAPLCWLLFIGALLSKTVACSLPAVLVLVLWWKKGKLNRKEILALGPMFLFGFCLAMVTVQMERSQVGAQGPGWEFSPVDRCLIAGRALWFYVGTLLWPYPLTFNYPRWHIDAGQVWQYLFPMTALLVLVGLFLARHRLGKGPVVACCIFAGTLLPALGFFNVYPMIFSFVADHFQYLACASLIALGTTLIHGGRQNLLLDSPRMRNVMAGGLLLLLGYLTWNQCAIYHDKETLWRDTLIKNPDSWLAHHNLGSIRKDQGHRSLAIHHYQRVLEIYPYFADTYFNLGQIYLLEKKPAQALPLFWKAVELKPKDGEANILLGITLVDLALPFLEKAVQLRPQHAVIRWILEQAGQKN